MPKLITDNGLTLVLFFLFTASITGQAIAGWHVENQDLERHFKHAISFAAYLTGPSFISSVFENWESEFLQMSAYVVLTAILIQRGSAESRDPDAPQRDQGVPASWLRANALSSRSSCCFSFRSLSIG